MIGATQSLFSLGDEMRIFKNKRTGKRVKLDESKDKHLIKTLERSPDYKELMKI